MTTSNPASDHKKKSRQLVAVCLTERGQDGQPGSKKERERAGEPQQQQIQNKNRKYRRI